MSDQSGAIPLGLTQQKAARPIEADQLELMGKQAAKAYRECSTNLSDSVVGIVKEARLAPEQVKRVCEFANTAAYLDAFEKSGEMRNVTFEGGPADPGKVLKDLNDGSNPAVNHVENSDYNPPVGTYKTASADDSLLAEAFGAGMEKTASAEPAQSDHSVHADPLDDINDMRVSLEGVHDVVMSKLSSSGVVYEDVCNDLCETVTQEVLNGTSMGDISRAWAGYSPSPSILKQAMVVVGKHLSGRGYTKEQLGESLSKVAQAGVIANPAHPLIERFVAFTKVAHGHRVLEHAVEVVDEQLGAVNTKLRGMVGAC